MTPDESPRAGPRTGSRTGSHTGPGPGPATATAADTGTDTGLDTAADTAPAPPRYPRDLHGHGERPPEARWPGGARVAVQVVLNYEEGGESCVLHGDAGSEAFLSEIPGAEPWPHERHWNMESVYEYGARAGFWRLHRLLSELAIPVTVFGVAEALMRSPAQTRAMLEAGWEMASHGLRWVEHRAMPEEVERAAMARAVALHEALTGARPRGWYVGRCSMNTVRLAAREGGFAYLADSYADDLPYWLRVEGRDQLVVPYALDANDMRFSAAAGFGTGPEFEAYLRDTLECLLREGGRMMSVGLHCRLAGRPGRAEALRRFLEHARAHDRVWLATRLEIARHWAREHPPEPRPERPHERRPEHPFARPPRPRPGAEMGATAGEAEDGATADRSTANGAEASGSTAGDGGTGDGGTGEAAGEAVDGRPSPSDGASLPRSFPPGPPPGPPPSAAPAARPTFEATSEREPRPGPRPGSEPGPAGAERPSEMGRAAFVARFGGVFERSPWVAERAWAMELGPAHDTAQGLHAAMARALREATPAERLAVLRAHPDLAGRLAAARRLTPESAAEQGAAGLDALTDAERQTFERLNAAYVARFAIPFILAVRDHDTPAILRAFERRLAHDPPRDPDPAQDPARDLSADPGAELAHDPGAGIAHDTAADPAQDHARDPAAHTARDTAAEISSDTAAEIAHAEAQVLRIAAHRLADLLP